MKVLFALLAIVVTQACAGTINNVSGDISKVAVEGHEAIQNIIHHLENHDNDVVPEPRQVEDIEDLKHKRKDHHRRDLEVRDNIDALFVEPQPFEQELEEFRRKLKHRKHHRRDLDGISVESAEFQFDEVQPDSGFDVNGFLVELQPFEQAIEALRRKHKHHKHHRRSFDGILDDSVENDVEAEPFKFPNFNVNFQRPQPIVVDAEEQKHKQHKHHIRDFIDQVNNIQNEVNQIKDDIHDAITTAHELVNNVHNTIDEIIHPHHKAESKNLVTDGATIIPELAHMGEEVIKALQNLVNNLYASQSLMADDF